MGDCKKTPLYDKHLGYNGKIIDFAGWLLPVQYEGIIAEHQAVRNNAGLFDVSHMGEVTVKGKDSEKFIQYLVTNDISNLKNNEIIYTLMCYENGGVVDDLLVYKYTDEQYLLVINAGNIDKDYDWIEKNSKNFDLKIKNISDKTAEMALQGSEAQSILQKICSADLSNIKFFAFKDNIKIAGLECLVSRTGYTGEDGFEIYTVPENAPIIWDKILEVGKDKGIKPAGLGCRDTLRFEVALPLYGNEISQNITPLEAGLSYFVKFNKENFIGKEALVKQKQEGLKRKLIGFQVEGRGITRHGYEILSKDGKSIGFVTTGYQSPTLNKSIGLGLVDIKYSELGIQIMIKVRKKLVPAKVVSKKFYKKQYKNQ